MSDLIERDAAIRVCAREWVSALSSAEPAGRIRRMTAWEIEHQIAQLPSAEPEPKAVGGD